MSIRIAPFEEDDLERLYGVQAISLKSITEKPNISLTDNYRVSKAASHVRSYIKLFYPCISDLVCGSGYSAGKVLGITNDQLRKLAHFNACIDTVEKEVIEYRAGEDEDKERYLFNGMAVWWLIDNLNIKERIRTHLLTTIRPCIGKKFECSVNNEKRGLCLLSNWYVESNNIGITQEDVLKYMYSKINEPAMTTVAIYINLLNAHGTEKAVKHYLKKMLVITELPTIPYNMRPALDNRKHPLTMAYSKLFNANNDYTVYQSGPLDEYKEHYKTVYALVNTIICNNYFTDRSLVSPDKDFKKMRPIMETLKGKTGSIRASMIARRQNNTGRSAVIVNPFLPLNKIGVPRSMIPKLYRKYSFSVCDLSPEEFLQHAHSQQFNEKLVDDLIKSGVITDIPMLLGRNPTLHRMGIQGFEVVITEGRALEVSPLVCPAFNMDFDGDTGHNSIPLTLEGKYEIKRLIMTDMNILLPKTGDSTICPRMDIIYGLYMCTRSHYKKGEVVARFNSILEFKLALFSQNIMVWDTVSVRKRGTDVAGRLAFDCCFTKGFIGEDLPIVEITAKTIKPYIEKLTTQKVLTFDKTINALVELGFKTANIYGTSVSMLQPDNPCPELDTVFEKFDKDMEEIIKLHDLGFYDPETYGVEYSMHLREVDKVISENMVDSLTERNMFKHMAVSGARGNVGNLSQMYRYKGQIQKSETELFNVAIKRGLRDQLTPMEHMIAVNGARKGQIAKSIKTADTGYMRRKIEHATHTLIITEEDCGTDEGITISRDDIMSFLYRPGMSKSDISHVNETIDEVMIRMISGRFCADNNLKITNDIAKAWVVGQKMSSVTIRSPLKCKNPCCQMCYGDDPSTRRTAAIGLPIGFLSAQSLAEPITQMTMKEFQLGGVARRDAIASPFERVNALIGSGNLAEKTKRGRFFTYDPVAWAPGKLVRTEHIGNQAILSIIPEGVSQEERAKYNYKETRVVPDYVDFKVGQHVNVGDTLRIVRGDTDPAEVLQYSGLDAVHKALLLNLYFVFRPTCDLIPKHIEVLLECLTGYMPFKTDLKELKMGKFYTRRQLCDLNKNYMRTSFMPAIRNVTAVTNDSVNFMESMIMENQRKVISNAVLNALSDTCTAPLVQIAFGKVPTVGTGYNKNFLEER